MFSKVVSTKGNSVDPTEQSIEQLRKENAELLTALEARTQENILLNEVISTVGSTLKLDEVLGHLVDIVVRAISEYDPDIGYAEVRDGPQEGDIRDAVEFLLKRDGNQPLDLLRSVPRPDSDDIDLHVCHVGIRLDRETIKRHQAQGGQQKGQGEHDEALVEREADESLDHAASHPHRSS